MTEKFRPNFLNPEIKVAPLTGDKYGQGAFVEVGNLENLPENIKEKIPSGYVIKKYMTSNDFFAVGFNLLSLEDGLLFSKITDRLGEYSELTSGGKLSEHSILDIVRTVFRENGKSDKSAAEFMEKTSIKPTAKRLKERHDAVKNYFSNILPDLVVQTQFFIGEDRATGKKVLFEIQPKVIAPEVGSNQAEYESFYRFFIRDWATDPKMAKKVLNDFIEKIRAQFPQKLDLFKEELGRFIDAISKFNSQSKYLQEDMAFPSNLKFTKEGLRLIDTNALVEKYGHRENKKVIQSWEKITRNSLDLLKIIKERL